ncbi:MAG: LysM peptidoglycan-binding domain-containing protein [Firmicutes bacterium]|nr:LysM peptidoglycan-binding domain-containing protein [Bacillota bacterium]
MNYKIVIDAGHGGTDPGASGNGIIEKDLALQISNYMYDRLKSLGIPVKIIRSTDETITPTERVNRVLDAFGNSKDVIVVSNHINAGGGEGAEVIYALRSTATLPNLILSELEDEGQIIRKAYQRRLPSDTSKDYYFMQRNTGNTESITVEYGFLDNPDDAIKLKNNYIDYTDAVIRALLEYIGYSTGDNTYTVKSGDSLWSIAKKFNVTVQELKEVNRLSSNLLNIGQVLTIPQEEDEIEGNTYTVKQGDSLYKIANQYGVTVQELKDINKLSSNILSVGQKLIIPQNNEVDDNTYIVKQGDSLYKIATQYNTTVDNLKSLNNLSSNILSIGQTLKVPTNVIVDTNNNVYVVKSGDNLYSIALRYDVSVDELKELNNLTSNILSIGQILKIPTELDENIYIVKKGDNLYSIANRYNTTVDEIKRKNNLVSNILSIGQTLII